MLNQGMIRNNLITHAFGKGITNQTVVLNGVDVMISDNVSENIQAVFSNSENEGVQKH